MRPGAFVHAKHCLVAAVNFLHAAQMHAVRTKRLTGTIHTGRGNHRAKWQKYVRSDPGSVRREHHLQRVGASSGSRTLFSFTTHRRHGRGRRNHATITLLHMHENQNRGVRAKSSGL
jgi:hypothetical protein